MTVAKNDQLITAERLGELLHYDRETGHFTWLVTRGSSALAGARAGTVSAKGYRVIHIEQRRYKAHRLAWFYVNGAWPDSLIDHVDRARDHNAICNLRQATNAQNLCNRGAEKDSQSGLKGASFHKDTRRWQAQISVDKRKIYLGLYDSAEEAHAAYVAAALRLHGPFARTA